VNKKFIPERNFGGKDVSFQVCWKDLTAAWLIWLR